MHVSQSYVEEIGLSSLPDETIKTTYTDKCLFGSTIVHKQIYAYAGV